MAKRITRVVFYLPDFWAPSLINGDDSGNGPADDAAIEAFKAWMVETYGCCICLTCGDESSKQFHRYHEGNHYGVLACNVLPYTFDVSTCEKMATVD